jgi:DsbC/DsbD-like thiol-disulfide interchange protein
MYRWASLAQHVADGFDDSIYEYSNDLTARTLLGRVMAEAPEPIRAKIIMYVDDIDVQFRSVSREVTAPVQKDKPESEWWFYRVPLNPGAELQADLDSQ